ncbi:hypothetical protein [Mycoplasma sp. SG1]|uniref:hypothetical protein n=1 Tax=Mycoplasma sp. SG1 TaxID=2810348 RepID=UPI0020246350|nr:hypothetical protein [Mycoplasma sp. SG1]URM53054.1 hypothetical protein JRW51_01770 [Mycoplasma sp. SG1]
MKDKCFKDRYWRNRNLPIILTKRLELISPYYWKKTAKLLFISSLLLFLMVFLLISNESIVLSWFNHTQILKNTDSIFLSYFAWSECILLTIIFFINVVTCDVSKKIWKENKIFMRFWIVYFLIVGLILIDFLSTVQSISVFNSFFYQKNIINNLNKTDCLKTKILIGHFSYLYFYYSLITASAVLTSISTISFIVLTFVFIFLGIKITNYRSTIIWSYISPFFTVDWEKIKNDYPNLKWSETKRDFKRNKPAKISRSFKKATKYQMNLNP